MKILFVDDEKIVREGMKTMIDWQAIGCDDFMTASTVTDAVSIIHRYHPEIVITDICMQQTTGIELAKMIKQRLPDTVIILLSAYDSFEYAREAIEIGVVKYLLKPLFPKELETVIREACEEVKKRAYLRQLLLEKNAGFQARVENNVSAGNDLYPDTRGESFRTDPEKLAIQAVNFIKKNFCDESFTINKLAVTLHISRGYLAKIFKRYCGQSTIEYLNDLRINKAKELLGSSKMTQSQIAECVGYANVYYFNAQFKKAIGITPGDYRKIKNINRNEKP
ncbi:MAG: response regulator [Holosporaceae bacterium]|jgi:two-component system response regulator YesN|nr:response regulator [Holosporaceae bacterium]